MLFLYDITFVVKYLLVVYNTKVYKIKVKAYHNGPWLIVWFRSIAIGWKPACSTEMTLSSSEWVPDILTIQWNLVSKIPNN